MMEKFPTYLLVVALALFDVEGRLLLQRRQPGKHHGGLWELPGGKVKPGENLTDALRREIGEELGFTLDPAQLEAAGWAQELQPQPIVLLLYTSQQTGMTITPCEDQLWGWFTPEEANALPLAPMDRQLLANLAL